MRWLITAWFVAALTGTGLAECDACLDGLCYTMHLLPVTSGYLEDIDRNTNTLFINDINHSKITQCNLDTPMYNHTTYGVNFEPIIVDQRIGKLYAFDMSNKSILKLDLINDIKVLSVPNVLVACMTFQDKLYYSGIYKGQPGIFTLENRVSRSVPGYEGYEFDKFIVDKNSHIYYGDAEIIRVKGNKKQTTFQGSIHRLSVDRNGNVVYFNKSRAVYRLEHDQLVEVGVVNADSTFLLFDRDNNFVTSQVFDKGPYYHYKKQSDTYCVVSIVDDRRIITKTDGPTTGPAPTEACRASDNGDSESTNGIQIDTCNCIPIATGAGTGLALIIVINAIVLITLYRKDKKTPIAVIPAPTSVSQQQLYVDSSSVNVAKTDHFYEEIL